MDAKDLDQQDQRRALIERIEDANDALTASLSRLHAADVLGIGITMAQIKVLYLLGPGDGLRMSQLAATLGVTLSTVSGLVDRLVDAGYAGRHDVPADRRQVVVYQTATGAALIERLHDFSRPRLDHLLESLTDDEVETIAHAIAILRRAADGLVNSPALERPSPPNQQAEAPPAARPDIPSVEGSAL